MLFRRCDTARMTQALSRSNWIRTPSLCQPLLKPLLRAAAMLWSCLASLFRMRFRHRARECHAEPLPAALPGTEGDPIKETPHAEPHGETTEGLILRAHEVRV